MRANRESATLVVHIGTAKTGSTSIQNMLRSLRRPLAAAGIDVPAAGRIENGSHHNLVCEFSAPLDYRPFLGGWDDLAAELKHNGSSARRFVISAEGLSDPANARQAIDRITALAEEADLNVRVVAYIRPQYLQIDSEYAQTVKAGSCRLSFDTYLTAALDDPRYDLNALFGPWRDAFGDRMAVCPVEAARMPGGVVPHFVDLLGAGDLTTAAARLPRLNQRIGAKQLEVLRLFNVACGQEMLDRKTTRRLLADLSRRLPSVLVDDVPFSGLGSGKRRAVAARFAEANARFARVYGIDPGGALFRETPPGDVRANRAGWRDLTAEERAAAARLVRKMAGLDLFGTAERRGTTAETDPHARPPWPMPDTGDALRRQGGKSRVRPTLRALIHRAPDWLVRTIRTARSGRLEYAGARARDACTAPWRRLMGRTAHR